MKDSSSRIALVTGANKGIGFEVARQLGERGFQVILTARDSTRGKAAAAKLAAAGAHVAFFPLDVADPRSVSALAKALARKIDHLDVLVNNAAILENDKVSVLDVTAGEVERTWRTNSLGPLLVAQALAPLLRKSKRGAVVNVSSGWGALHDMTDEAPAYGISKTALNAVTRQLAAAFKSDGVAVNSVCPGWVRTDMGGPAANRSVAEGADTIVWLATDAPRKITGQFLRDSETHAMVTKDGSLPGAPVSLSLPQARRLALHALGLLRRDPFGRGWRGAWRAIEHLGFIQLDTISVVERAHHHQLWSRVSNYRPADLDRLVSREHLVFEYWSHAAAYLPMSSYRYCLPRMRRFAEKMHWSEHTPELATAMHRVLDRIRADGPLQSRDFVGGPTDGDFWGYSKVERRVFHELFMRGEIMVAGRAGFAKIFDLTERVLRPGMDLSIPTAAEMVRHRVRETIRAQGVAALDQIGHLRSLDRLLLQQVLAELIESREVCEVAIHGLERTRYFAFVESIERIPRSPPAGSLPAQILSPFDAGVIHRRRVRELFGFDYQIECYVPAPKRKFGYFSLPVLADGVFIGRIDAKADRPHRNLLVKNFIIEPGAKDSAARAALASALPAFAAFNGCERFTLARAAMR